MLDTICFSLKNDENKYNHLIDNLILNRSNQNRSGTLIRKFEPDATYSKVQLYQFNANENEKVYQFTSDYIKIPSSTYDAYFRIDYQKNEVSFNLSIPKAIYGTNVIQFVPHAIENENVDRLEFDNVVYKNNAGVLLKRLLKFMRSFITISFLDYSQFIQMSDVRIDRLDLCYNQIFPDKESALSYINYMKKIRKPRVNDKTKDITQYKTSVYIVTQFYTFKIYHKGTEFEKNDMRELEKINELRKKQDKKPRYNIQSDQMEGLKDYADRLVRYEVEFRSKFLTYLFRKHLFRKDCKKWKEIKKLSNAFSSYERIYKTSLKKKEGIERKAYLENFYVGNSFPYVSYKEIVNDKKNVAKMLKAKTLMMNKASFTLDISEAHKEYNRLTKNEYFYDKNFMLKKEAIFGTGMLKIMLSKFYSMVKAYQVTNIADEESLIKDIVQYNMNCNLLGQKKINISKIRKYLVLMETYSIKDMVEMKIIDRSTAYRLEKQLEKFGYSGRSVAKNLHEGDLNFYEYQNYMVTNLSMPLKNFFFK